MLSVLDLDPMPRATGAIRAVPMPSTRLARSRALPRTPKRATFYNVAPFRMDGILSFLSSYRSYREVQMNETDTLT